MRQEFVTFWTTSPERIVAVDSPRGSLVVKLRWPGLLTSLAKGTISGRYIETVRVVFVL